MTPLAALLLLAPSDAELVLIAHAVTGDPIGLAVDAGESRLALAYGGRVVFHELLDEEPFVSEPAHELPWNASLFDLALVDDTLYVAAGEDGLFAVGPRAKIRFASPEDSACTALAVRGPLLLAAFVSRGEAELRAYEIGGSPEPSWHHDLGSGLPTDLEIAAECAWVALGRGGVRCIPLSSRERAHPPDLPPCLASDLAVGAGLVFAAADASLAWTEASIGASTPGAWHRRPAPRSPRAYCVAVEANAEHVVTARLRGPASLAAGAPYGLAGTIGLDLEVGGVERGSVALGRRESLTLSALPATDSSWGAEAFELPLPPCGFRALALGERRLYGQLLKLGARVWEIEDGALRELWSLRAEGHPCIDGAFSLAAPEVLLFGTDSTGSRVRGVLEACGEPRLRVRPGSEAQRTLGLRVGAQWLDESGAEWFLCGGFLDWQLVRFRPGHEEGEWSRWSLPPPVDPDGERGVTYFNSTCDGDVVLATRSGSRHGVLAWRASELSAAALEIEPGSSLALAPRFQLRSHPPEAELRLTHTWGASVVSTTDGRRIAVVAAGRDARPSGVRPGRGLVLELHESEPPTLLAELRGAGEGHWVSCAAVLHGKSVLAAFGDLAGAIEVYDLDTPDEPRHLTTWWTPRSVFDDLRDPVLDLAFVGNGDSRELLAVAGRAGLLQLALGRPGERQLRLVQRHDTPGWAAGIAVRSLGIDAKVFVGDQKCGGHLYEWRARGQKRK